jgi:Outer membrane protein
MGSRAGTNSTWQRPTASSGERTCWSARLGCARCVEGVHRLSNALKKQDAAEKLVTASKSAFDAVLDSYKQGLSTYTEVVTAERNLTAALATSHDTQAAIYTTQAALALSVGDLARPMAPLVRKHEDETGFWASRTEQHQQSSTSPARLVSAGRPCWVSPGHLGIGVRGSTVESPLTYDRYPRFLFSGLDDLHCKRADADACRALDCASVPSEAISRSGAARLFMPDDHLHVCDLDPFLSKLKCIKQPFFRPECRRRYCLSGWSCRGPQVHSQDYVADHRCGRGADHTLCLGNYRTTSPDR